MQLTKGEYTQFSLRGKIYLLEEYGMLLIEKYLNDKIIKIYRLYDFFVEVLIKNNSPIKAEPLLFCGMINYYC